MAVLEFHTEITEKQAEFEACEAKSAGIIGGVGSGKSFECCDWLIERFHEWPRSVSCVVSTTYEQAKDGALVTFKKRLEHYGYSEGDGFRQNKTDLSITITKGPAKGHVIKVRYIANNAYRRLKGLEFDSFWCDELQEWPDGSRALDFIFTRNRTSPVAQTAYGYKDAVGEPRCRMQPRLRFSANPPWTTTHWLYRDFVQKAHKDDTQDPVVVFHWSTYDNYLRPDFTEYIEFLRGRMSPEVFRIEVLGEWGDIGVGRVYSSYSRMRHASRFQREYQVAGAPAGVMGSLPSLDARGYPMLDPSKPIAWMHDFGVDPRASLICQVHTLPRPLVGFQRELVYVVGEIRIRDGSTDKMIAEFVRLYPPGSFSNNRIYLYGDATGINRNSTTADSDWAMLQYDPRLRPYKMSIHKRGQNPPVVDRVNAVNSKLLNARDEIGILIREDLPHICEDLQQTHWLEGTRQLDHGSRSREIFRTHMSDSLGYFIEREWPLQLSSGPRKVGEAITY